MTRSPSYGDSTVAKPTDFLVELPKFKPHFYHLVTVQPWQLNFLIFQIWVHSTYLKRV